MAGTINYAYDPNQQVWTIVVCDDEAPVVKEGKVVRVKAEVLVAGEEIEYDIQLVNQNGTTEVAEIDIFATLNAAVTEYEIRLT